FPGAPPRAGAANSKREDMAMRNQSWRICSAVVLATTTLAWIGTGRSRAAEARETRISGRVFADFTDKTNEDEGTKAKSADSGVGTDVKRFYAGVAHTFDGVWAASFVSDGCDKGARRYDLSGMKASLQSGVYPD